MSLCSRIDNIACPFRKLHVSDGTAIWSLSFFFFDALHLLSRFLFKVREGMHTTFEVLAVASLATPCNLRLSMRHEGEEEARTQMFSMMPGTGSERQIGFGDNALFATAFFEVAALPRPCCVIPVP